MKCISEIYVRKLQMFVPCGKCAFCIKKSIDGWCLRLKHEMEVSSSAFFVTLTYDNDHIPENHQLDKAELQRYFKRLRFHNPGIRYFAIGEYGSNFKRPHYHAVIFNCDNLDLITSAWSDKDGKPIGFVVGDRATHGRIRYMVSYMAMVAEDNHEVKPFRIMSRNPGLGNSYVEKMGAFHRARSDSVVYYFDTPNAMPRFYRDKIFTPAHRRYVVLKQMKYSLEHPVQVDSMDHEKLLKKLTKKLR